MREEAQLAEEVQENTYSRPECQAEGAADSFGKVD